MTYLKFWLASLLLFIVNINSFAQVSGNFTVNGDISKYYPVTFFDGGWASKAATEMQIGRSDVHQDGSLRGSIIANFRYHVTNWGHGSSFIDADIRQYTAANPRLIAGWKDGTPANSSYVIIIWLRGNTTYTYRSNYTVNPTVYDGVQNPLPYKELVGTTSSIDHSYKTAIDSVVNNYGMTYGNTAYFNGSANNYIAGSLGIGTVTPGTYKLAVEGTIGARKVKVMQGSWADFVFDSSYTLPSLKQVQSYIKDNHHLPDMPSAEEVKERGLDVGEMNKKLLQKIEELTLYLINQQQQISELKQQNEQLLKSRCR